MPQFYLVSPYYQFQCLENLSESFYQWATHITQTRSFAFREIIHKHCFSVTNDYKLVPAIPYAGKVTVDLAMSWPCVTDYKVV